MNLKPLTKARVALVYGPGNLAVDYCAALLRGIERGLLENGAEVDTCNLALLIGVERGVRTSQGRESTIAAGVITFLNQSAAPYDICLALLHDAYLTANLQEALRKKCHRVVNYPLNLLDQPHLFARATEFCDETFCAEEPALADLRHRYGARKIRYVPLASDPHVYWRVATPESPRALFVGTIYADRHALLTACAEVIPVSVFGSNFTVPAMLRATAKELIKHRNIARAGDAALLMFRAATRDKRMVSDEEFVRLAGEHGVSLGLSTVHQELTGLPLRKVRLRDYDAGMCGMCHVSARMPELERAFSEGEEMLFYDEPEQLLDILRKVAAGNIEWPDIGRRARLRAAADHTWTVRLRAAFA